LFEESAVAIAWLSVVGEWLAPHAVDRVEHCKLKNARAGLEALMM
jgi:hypothetical protein